MNKDLKNESNQPVQLTSCMSDKQKLRTEDQSNPQAQLTFWMANKQKKFQDTKSEQWISTAHILYDTETEKISQKKTINQYQYNSQTVWQTSRKKFRRQNENSQPKQLTSWVVDE